MNNTFKANLIKTLANKKGNKGFTLIELLVVVIIIGVLAAIALPNLLGQVGKARESEAKNMVGAVNRAQQAHFVERNAFAANEDELEVPISGLKFYTLTITDPGDGSVFADGINNDNAGTRDYAGVVAYNTNDRAFTTEVCRANAGPAYTIANIATGSTTGVVTGATDVATCPTGSESVNAEVTAPAGGGGGTP